MFKKCRYYAILLVILFSSQLLAVSVNTSSELCMQEQAYLDHHAAQRAQAVRSFIGEDTDQTPSISFCFSGGGYRAAICTLGFMIGAQETGLLPTAKHMSVLSGSTWMLANLLLRNCSLDNYKYILRERVAASFWNPETLDIQAIEQKLQQQHEIRGHIRPTDIWGGILAQRLWGDMPDAQNITFESIRQTLHDESDIYYPFPVFNTILTKLQPYEWMEVTPFTTGCASLAGYVPTHVFDSPFENGECPDDQVLPELSLSTFIATFGSPYSLSVGDILKFMLQIFRNSWINNQIEALDKHFGLCKHRILPSFFNNFSYGMTGHGDLSSHKHIALADAGIDYDLPFPPLLRRERMPDIIVVCDASSDACDKGYPELQYARGYARQHKLTFPDLKSPTIIKEDFAIFEQEGAPTIIYLENPVKDSTLKLQYDGSEFDTLCNEMTALVHRYKELIAMAIRRKC